MSVIQAAHYGRTEQNLSQEQIVVDMAAGLPIDLRTDGAVNEHGEPSSAFMGAALAEYKRRGGTTGCHIGAVANALLKLKREEYEAQAADLNAVLAALVAGRVEKGELLADQAEEELGKLERRMALGFGVALAA